MTNPTSPWQIGEASYGEYDADEQQLALNRAYLIHDGDGTHVALVMGADEGYTTAPIGAAHARLIAQAPVLRDELRETELNLTQTLIAVHIGRLGRRAAQKRLDFVLGELERIRDRHSALLASLEEQ